MIKIAAFVFNAFGENSYVIYDESGEAILIDPGNYDADESAELTGFIEENGLKPVLVANTHAHVDHVLGVAFAKRKWGIPFALHAQDAVVLKSVRAYAPNYGFAAYDEPEIDQWLVPGQPLKFGTSSLEIIFVPGHAPGHVAFYEAESKQLIAGDVLFRESIGRTDLPGGNHATLLQSIREKLFVLPDDVKVFPGHGPSTTIGHEKKYNPFFRNSGPR